MKTLRIIALFMLCMGSVEVVQAQVIVSWPVYNTVFQRPGNNGSLSFNVGGQCTLPNTDYQLQLRITTLNVQTGATVYVYSDWTTFLYSRPVGGVFNTNVSLSCGWYLVEVRALVNGSPFGIAYGVRVGVGDVFIIAGQSNAQGVTTTASYDEDPYNGVVADLHMENCSKDIPAFPVMYPIFQPNSQASPTITYPIATQGPTNWAYTVMGNRLAASTGCPVAIFNTAITSTAVKNWDDSRTGTAYNVYDGSIICGSDKMPYTILKNALNYYGSLFGVRAVLWHQGEADNQQSTTTADYQARLGNVISQTRSDFNNGLNWYIARVSYNPEMLAVRGDPPVSSSVISAQNYVANANNVGPNTDNIGIPRNDPAQAIHFGGSQLKDLGEAWKNSDLLMATPVAGNTSPATISVSRSGNTYFLTAQPPSGFGQIYWVSEQGRLSSYFSTATTISIYNDGSGTDVSYRFYAVNGTTSNIVVSPKVKVPLPSGSARLATTATLNEPGTVLTIGPNPAIDQTIIRVKLAQTSPIRLDILDEQGRIVNTMVNGTVEAGLHEYSLNINLLPANVYLCRLAWGDSVITQKILKATK